MTIELILPLTSVGNVKDGCAHFYIKKAFLEQNFLTLNHRYKLTIEEVKQ